MTDSTPPPPADPTPPPAAPAYSAAPVGVKPKQSLSLTGFILGIAGWVFSWVPVLGLLAGIAAIILSLLGRTREPGAPKWMWIVGLILGILATLGGIIYIIAFFTLIAVGAASYNSY